MSIGCDSRHERYDIREIAKTVVGCSGMSKSFV